MIVGKDVFDDLTRKLRATYSHIEKGYRIVRRLIHSCNHKEPASSSLETAARRSTLRTSGRRFWKAIPTIIRISTQI